MKKYGIDSITHFGILGMRWGIRRYQNKDGSLTDAGRSRYFKNTSDSSSRERLVNKVVEDFGNVLVSSIPNKYNSWNTLIGDVKKLREGDITSKRAKKLADQFDEKRDNSKIDKETGLYLKSKEMTIEEDVARVNPEFKNWDENTKNNCLSCTITYEMRRRGYDVTALKDASPDVGITDAKIAFKGLKTKEIKGSITEEELSTTNGYENYLRNGIGKDRISQIKKAAEKELRSAPKSRGEFGVNFDRLFVGHSMVYETDGVGNYKIIDSQRGDIYNSLDEVYAKFDISRIELTRLDNLKLNSANIKEFCR